MFTLLGIFPIIPDFEKGRTTKEVNSKGVINWYVVPNGTKLRELEPKRHLVYKMHPSVIWGHLNNYFKK